MKKLISLITAALTAFSVTPLITSAESAPDLSDDNIMHESHTHIVGDLNDDGEITISDLVTMSNVLLRKGYDDAMYSTNTMNGSVITAENGKTYLSFSTIQQNHNK